ncbi:hypothetical protein, partial [Acinetobacter ursingii]|uniref:hypothetical protein n=1 Tax=Acinetobacter ursingii TaxID=108980 RepID=UPI001D17AEE0
NGATGRVSGLTNTAWDPNATYNQKQAATEEQLKSVSDVTQNANKGWTDKSDSTLASTQVKPKENVDNGQSNKEKKLKGVRLHSDVTTTFFFFLVKFFCMFFVFFLFSTFHLFGFQLIELFYL